MKHHSETIVDSNSVKTRGVCRAVALALAFCGALSGFGDIVAWYHFDGTVGESCASGTTFQNAVNPGKYPAVLDSVDTGSYNAPMVTNFLVSPFNVYRDGLAGAPVANATAIAYAASVGNERIKVTEESDDRDLHLQTGTVECFVKFKTTDSNWRTLISRLGSDSGQDFRLWHQGTNLYLDYRYIDGSGNMQTKTSVAVSSSGYSTYLNDGLWHHLALTLDEATRVFQVFVDYKPVGSVTLLGALNYSDGQFWTFGGPANPGGRAQGGSWDEIRFSDEVLSTAKMLHFGNTVADGEAVLYLPFENDFASVARTPFSAGDDAYATSRTTLQAENKLWYEDADYNCILDGDKTVVRTPNDYVLAISNGVAKLALSDFNLRCFDSLTFEFFIKGEASTTVVPYYGKILGLGTDGMNSGRRLCEFSRSQNSDRLVYSFDTPGKVNTSLGASGSVFDGAWHHFALTMDTQLYDGGTTVTNIARAYLDYAPAGSGSAPGAFWASPNLVLHVGDSSRNVSFRIDEIRVSKGVLPSAKFMRWRNRKGLILYFR